MNFVTESGDSLPVIPPLPTRAHAYHIDLLAERLFFPTDARRATMPSADFNPHQRNIYIFFLKVVASAVSMAANWGLFFPSL